MYTKLKTYMNGGLLPLSSSSSPHFFNLALAGGGWFWRSPAAFARFFISASMTAPPLEEAGAPATGEAPPSRRGDEAPDGAPDAAALRAARETTGR